MVLVFAALGDTDRAFTRLDESVTERTHSGSHDPGHLSCHNILLRLGTPNAKSATRVDGAIHRNQARLSGPT
jgi:hypothetical protein